MNATMNEIRKLTFSLVSGDVDGAKNPSVFSSIVGQREACNKLYFYAQSHSSNTPMPTLLFTGSQGLGKSYMANKCAQALGRKLVEVNCGSLDDVDSFVRNVLLEKVAGNEQVTLFFDEAHKLNSDITTVLLTFLNPNPANKNVFVYNNIEVEYDFRKINTIFATTDAHKMFRPLVNRCVEIYFNIYSNAELFEILKMYLPGVNLACNKDDVAYACRGRGRDAFLLASDISRYCNMKGDGIFNDEDWKNFKSIFGIHGFGLRTQEVQLLRIMATRPSISLANLAVMMGVNVQNIESELEIRVRELGLIENECRGRTLTEAGRKYLKTN